MKSFNNTEKGIISAIFQNGALSKRELCEFTSSSWAGISKYVSSLLKSGIVESLPPEKHSEPGRPAMLIDINTRLLCAGVSVSYTQVQTVLINTKGEVLHFKTNPLNRGDDPVPEALKILNHLMTPEIKDRVISLGIAFPGIIDPSKQRVLSSVYFTEFLNRHVTEEFEIALQMDIPITIERNAVCELSGIVTECKIKDDTLLISLNSGVSAALFLDGRILDGNSGSLARLGHFPDQESQIPCLCGKSGCIDTVVGEVAWERAYRKISKLPGAKDSFYHAIESGMPQAVKMLRHSLESLPAILNSLLILFDPENLIFSADMPPSSTLVFSTLMDQNSKVPVPNIRIADNLSAAKGAAFLGMMQLFK